MQAASRDGDWLKPGCASDNKYKSVRGILVIVEPRGWRIYKSLLNVYGVSCEGSTSFNGSSCWVNGVASSK
jgi:hypothetical protein